MLPAFHARVHDLCEQQSAADSMACTSLCLLRSQAAPAASFASALCASAPLARQLHCPLWLYICANLTDAAQAIIPAAGCSSAAMAAYSMRMLQTHQYISRLCQRPYKYQHHCKAPHASLDEDPDQVVQEQRKHKLSFPRTQDYSLKFITTENVHATLTREASTWTTPRRATTM